MPLPPPPVAVLSAAQDGVTVDAPLGAVVRVRLPANASTGYSWQMMQGAPSIAIIDRRFSAPSATPGRVGVPGEQVFDLQVLGEPGHTSPVALAYKPPGRRFGFARVWRARIHITPPASQARERR